MRVIDADYTKEHLYACELNGRPLHKMELEEVLAAIDEVPTIEAEPRWIPCSERLPENPGYGEEYPLVIFCTDKRSYVGFYEYYEGGRWWNYTADEDYVVGGVIAWMPLPEPYKVNEVEE